MRIKREYLTGWPEITKFLNKLGITLTQRTIQKYSYLFLPPRLFERKRGIPIIISVDELKDRLKQIRNYKKIFKGKKRLDG